MRMTVVRRWPLGSARSRDIFRRCEFPSRESGSRSSWLLWLGLAGRSKGYYVGRRLEARLSG